MPNPSAILDSLVDAGFDESQLVPEYNPDGETLTGDYVVRVRCSQCEAMTINGTPAHEMGCPHIARDAECPYCGYTDCDGDCMGDDDAY
jgi:hypothetical protein